MRRAFLCLSAAAAAFVLADVSASVYVDFAHAGISNAQRETTTVVNRANKGDRMMSMHTPTRPQSAPVQPTPPAAQQPASQRPKWLDGCEPAASLLSPSGASAIGARCVS